MFLLSWAHINIITEFSSQDEKEMLSWLDLQRGFNVRALSWTRDPSPSGRLPHLQQEGFLPPDNFQTTALHKIENSFLLVTKFVEPLFCCNMWQLWLSKHLKGRFGANRPVLFCPYCEIFFSQWGRQPYSGRRLPTLLNSTCSKEDAAQGGGFPSFLK